MNILVCDDDIDAAQFLKIHVAEYLESRYIPFLINTSSDPLKIAEDGVAYDIAFLDIEMAGIDGIELAAELKRRNESVALFFVTSHSQYIDTAMNLQPLRFFEKPFDAARLNSGLDNAVRYVNNRSVELSITNINTLSKIVIDDIRYVENSRRSSIIRTGDGKIFCGESFESVCSKLPNTFFFLTHKSFFVNVHHVVGYAYRYVTLDTGEKISVASRRQSDFHKYWLSYLRAPF